MKFYLVFNVQNFNNLSNSSIISSVDSGKDESPVLSIKYYMLIIFHISIFCHKQKSFEFKKNTKKMQ